MKSSRGVNYDNVAVSCLCGIYRVKNNSRRVCSLGVLYYINTGSVRPNLKLVDCRGTECVGRSQNDLFALGLVHRRQFAYGRGFTYAVDAYYKYDGRYGYKPHILAAV